MGIIRFTGRMIKYTIAFIAGAYVGSCMNDYRLTVGYEKAEKPGIEEQASKKQDGIEDMIKKIMLEQYKENASGVKK